MTGVSAMPGRRIVVGYDGSPGSRAVLEHAVDAARDEGIVFVVHAYPRPRGWFAAPDDQERLDAALERAESLIRALREGGGPLDLVAWEPEIIAGDPAGAIAAVAAARHADEIVVGSRRFGLARVLHPGSVAKDLIRIARVPVTVIPHGVAPSAEAA